SRPAGPRSRGGGGGRQLRGPDRRLDRPSSGGRGLDEPLHLARGVLDQTAHLIVRLAEPGEHVLRHDLRIARVRAPDTDADAVKVGAAQTLLQGLQPVVAGQAAAEPRLHAAEGEVHLVVDHDDPVERHAESAACRPRRASRVVHESLREQHADAGPPRAGPAVGVEARVLRLRAREIPARGQEVGHLESDVVTRPLVLAGGVSEPEEQPIDAAAALALVAAPEESRQEASSPPPSASPPPSGASSAGAASPSACSPATASASSPTSSVSSSTSGSGSSAGMVTVAMIVSSG